MVNDLIITESVIILAATLFPIGILSLVIFVMICCKIVCEKKNSSIPHSGDRVEGQSYETTIDLMGIKPTPQITIRMKELNEML